MGLFSGGLIFGVYVSLTNWWAYYRGCLYTGGLIFGTIRYVVSECTVSVQLVLFVLFSSSDGSLHWEKLYQPADGGFFGFV